jgi:superfamily II DNA or RNA helicase
MIRLESPTLARLPDTFDERLLQAHLKYVDKKVDFEIKRLKNGAHWYVKDEESQQDYDAKMAALKASRQKSLLFRDESGLWTYSGLAPKLAEKFSDGYEADYTLPEPKLIPYANKPKHEARHYQTAAADALLATAGRGPRRVEIGTGLGKSTIIRMVLKQLGLKSIIMAPSTNIAEQLFDDLVHHFGKRYVGFFGGGKKQADKLFTVGIDDSLTKVEKGSEHWKELSKAQVFIADESHLCPAETLQRVCFGLAAAAPYRFFFSATQVRNDGLELVLDGITGETVYSMTVREGVDEGYLARPHFRMVRTQSDEKSYSSDPNKLTRAHLYYNPRVNRAAAMLANRFVGAMKKPTVILVEELEQFTHLLPHLKHEVAFAHGPLTKDTKKLVPSQFHDQKPSDLVEQFNAGKIPILVGTSCISTGTDIRVVEATLYLQGKSSEVKVKQAVGRDTRGGSKGFVMNPWTNQQKVDCIHVDFDVVNVDTVHRHADIRAGFYDEIYGPVEYIDL